MAACHLGVFLERDLLLVQLGAFVVGAGALAQQVERRGLAWALALAAWPSIDLR